MVARLIDLGAQAVKVPLSGAVEDFSGDIYLRLPGMDTLVAEVKARANGDGWRTLEKWLDTADVLFLMRDRAEPLVAMPWAIWADLVRALHGHPETTADRAGPAGGS